MLKSWPVSEHIAVSATASGAGYISRKIGPAISGKARPLIPETAPATAMPATTTSLPPVGAAACEYKMKPAMVNPRRRDRLPRSTKPETNEGEYNDSAERSKPAAGLVSDAKLIGPIVPCGPPLSSEAVRHGRPDDSLWSARPRVLKPIRNSCEKSPKRG